MSKLDTCVECGAQWETDESYSANLCQECEEIEHEADTLVDRDPGDEA